MQKFYNKPRRDYTLQPSIFNATGGGGTFLLPLSSRLVLFREFDAYTMSSIIQRPMQLAYNCTMNINTVYDSLRLNICMHRPHVFL